MPRAAIAAPLGGAGRRLSGSLAREALSWRGARLAAGALVAATALLPREDATLAVLAVVILLGVPHGALDGEIARTWLRPRFGRWWFPVFAAPYLGAAALVLLAWRLAPLATLVGFLTLSVRHFGEEDARSDQAVEVRPVEVLACGGLPVAVPTLVHPGEVASLFSTVAATPLHGPPAWLLIAAWCWVPPALFWFARAVARRRWSFVAEAAGLTGAFVLLPPLAAFGLYFVCVHAPRHVRALVADPHRAPRVDGPGAALVRSLPITGLTFVLGAALWPFYAGPVPERLLALTLQGLAALTLPHMILHGLTANDARAAASKPGSAG